MCRNLNRYTKCRDSNNYETSHAIIGTRLELQINLQDKNIYLLQKKIHVSFKILIHVTYIKNA